MISRRQLLLNAASAMLLPAEVLAEFGVQKKFSWPEFQTKMTDLANAEALGKIDQKAVVENGLKTLQQLDVNSLEFRQAVDGSYETGNRYWLWQRLIKQRNLNGGILTIDDNQMVQLHDHPGATGMVRIISGEAEVWLFDEVKTGKGKQGSTKGSGSENTGEQAGVELVRVSHRVLRLGDMAVLTPEKGNIHALRAVSQQCSMLDFFIPPYQRSQRSWYEPLTDNWLDKERVICQKIPQHAYTMA